MTEPRRWRETDGVPGEVARLLSRGSPTRPMPRNVGERAKKRLAVLALPAAASIILSWKGLALAALAVAGAVGAHAVATRRDDAATIASSHSAPRLAPPVLSAPPTSDLPTVSSQTPSIAESRTSGDAPPPSRSTFRPLERTDSGTGSIERDTLAGELALVGRARASLDADPRSALAVLDEHARRFPKGKLTMERELLALDALDRLGRSAEARERAQRLLAVARGTIYEPRVRAHLDDQP